MDANGIGDLCDNCPSWCNSSQEDSDSDGTCDACQNMAMDDPDGDGVTMGDNSSLMRNPEQEDEDSDGAGGSCDNCIADANPFQEDLDNNGIEDHCEAALDIPIGTPICATVSLMKAAVFLRKKYATRLTTTSTALLTKATVSSWNWHTVLHLDSLFLNTNETLKCRKTDLKCLLLRIV